MMTSTVEMLITNVDRLGVVQWGEPAGAAVPCPARPGWLLPGRRICRVALTVAYNIYDLFYLKLFILILYIVN